MRVLRFFACWLAVGALVRTPVASAFISASNRAVARHGTHRPENRKHDRTPARSCEQTTPARCPRIGLKRSGEEGSGQEPRSGYTTVSVVKNAVATLVAGLALAGPLAGMPEAAQAGGKRMVGEIGASGLVFKDKLNVEAFSDPKVKGVTLYLSDFSRPVTDKLINGDIFSDPSSAGLFCVRSGPMEVSTGLDASKEGEELFKEDRSFFKSIVVRRLYDKEANNVVYVSYSSKLDPGADGNKSRFKSSLCALHVE